MESDSLAQELSDQDRILLVFGYLGPLAVVSLVASRREFVKWHAKQGLALSLSVAAIYLVVLRPLIHFFDRVRWTFFSAVFSELFWATTWLVALGVLLMMLVSIVRGLEGERFKLPILGDLADRL